jgi:hypothetical protein
MMLHEHIPTHDLFVASKIANMHTHTSHKHAHTEHNYHAHAHAHAHMSEYVHTIRYEYLRRKEIADTRHTHMHMYTQLYARICLWRAEVANNVALDPALCEELQRLLSYVLLRVGFILRDALKTLLESRLHTRACAHICICLCVCVCQELMKSSLNRICMYVCSRAAYLSIYVYTYVYVRMCMYVFVGVLNVAE